VSFGGVAVIGLLLAVAACARAVDPLPGYVRASVEERAELMRAIADYYGVRGRAFVSGEATTRLATFPKLEPARIYVHGTSAVAFVHGWEIWNYNLGLNRDARRGWRVPLQGPARLSRAGSTG